jgi:LPXTG-motif cell wall-anchored protein
MKKVYLLAGGLIASFGALSVGAAAFASSGCNQSSGCPSVPDTVPVTESVPTTPETTPPTMPPSTPETTAGPTSSVAPQTTEQAGSGGPTTTGQAGAATTSSEQVGQEAPTTTARPAGDSLLPNTGTDIAMTLGLAALAAGTGAATLLVRRRNAA